MTRPFARDEVRRVLVRCPTWLGDTVMGVPVLRSLRRALPHAEIWGSGPWVGSVLEAEPALDRGLAEAPGWRGRLGRVRALRLAGMDLVVLLPNSFGAALDAWLAGARWRVGYATDGRSALLTHAVPAAHAWQHQVDAYLALLAPLGIEPAETRPRLVVPAERRAEARELLGRVGLRPGEPAVAIQLGAAFGPSKLWASDRLAELARRLDVRGVPVVFLGAPSAAPLLRAVEAHLGARPATLVGEDHPAVLPALLAEFAVVVAPDSGPAHVAAAVGVPGVTLFGPTDPRLSAPRGPGQAALWHSPVCAPCFLPRCPLDHRCLGRLSVEEVEDRVWEHLRARAAAE